MKPYLLLALLGISFFGAGFCLPAEGDSVKLRRDGVYALLDTSRTPRDPKIKWSEIHKIYSPFILVNNENAIFLNYLNFVDSSVLRLEQHVVQDKDLNNYVGIFHIIKDTIFASLPTGLEIGGGRTRLFNANYRGTIKNGDTIINWQLVPPYPKVNMKFNDNLDLLRTPHLLYFIESKELLGLDSLYQVRLRETQKAALKKRGWFR